MGARPAKTMTSATPLSRFMTLSGESKPPAAFIELRAGPLSMLFDPELAFLRHIRYGDRVVLLGVYAAVRDRNWGTVEPQVKDLRIKHSGESFEIDFQVECVEAPIDFLWRGRITGSARGTIRFTMDGEARSTFPTNRTGFCVLHPIEGVAGQPCTIEKTGGRREDSRFPNLISPHQPFFDVRAIRHEVTPGVWAEVRMEGEVFEAEDQRNWTDASFKTYCTPLARPFPVELAKGARIRQSVELTLEGAVAAPGLVLRGPEVVAELSKAPSPLPPLGFGLAADAPKPGSKELQRLRAAGPAHLRVDLKLASLGWKDYLRRAVEVESRELKAPLEAAVFVDEGAAAQLESLAAAAREMKANVRHWLVFGERDRSTPDALVALAREILPGAVGGGTNANFTELNRERPGRPADVVCYSVNPQVHAFDNLSLVETFEGLRHTVRTARSFAAGAKLAVTPVTLKPRFNPVATAPAAPDPSRLPSQVDVRQMSLFGAGWTLGTLAALFESGADSATFYETTGWKGLMETAAGSPMPQRFPSTPGAVFPLYHVFADLAGCSQTAPVAVSAPLEVAALACWRGEWLRLLLANLTPEVRLVRVANAGIRRAALWRMDEWSVAGAAAVPEGWRRSAARQIEFRDDVDLALPPYAYARLDQVGG